MDWFKRKKVGLTVPVKKEVPDGLWIKCEQCGEILFKKQLQDNLNICRKCNFHYRISSHDYLNLLLEPDSYTEYEREILTVDPLKFKDSKKYTERIEASIKKTGLTEAVRIGEGNIGKFRVIIGVMDFSFMGGSVGSVVGERLFRAVERAMEGKPLIIISSSGGMRMQEGAVSLMQMAKVSSALAMLSRQRIPYISILTNPTTGGTTASFSMLGDIIITEPGALIGFAGPRVIKQTIGQDLPPGFQRAEFLLEHGFIDIIVNRRELKDRLITILGLL